MTVQLNSWCKAWGSNGTYAVMCTSRQVVWLEQRRLIKSPEIQYKFLVAIRASLITNRHLNNSVCLTEGEAKL